MLSRRIRVKKNIHLGSNLTRIFPFLNWLGQVDSKTIKADLLAGLTGAFIVLPQGVAFAMVAGLPPEYGLYTAIVPPIVAALFGSSYHLISGPTTAISIVVFSTLSPMAEPGSMAFIQLALVLTFMAGIYQLLFGLLRLGTLINFVSHTVVVGFTAGAAALIATGQLKHALGIHIPGGSSFIETWQYLIHGLDKINGYELTIALATLITAGVLKHFWPKLPGLLFGMIIGSVVGVFFSGDMYNVRFLNAIPARLPQLSIPNLSLNAIRNLAPEALAVSLLGLIEALSIARSIAVKSNQHINGNQEFIGQGISNLVGSFFSSYAASGSFTRSGINYEAGAKTPLAAIFAAVFLAMVVLFIAPLTVYLPLAAMGGVILLVAFKLIDFPHIKEILITSRSESFVLLATFIATLTLELEFAIYIGVLLSLAFYLTHTSHPHIAVMAPDPDDPIRRLTDIEEKPLPECPQLKIIRIDGSLFFGAVSHIVDYFEKTGHVHPSQKHVLIVAVGINFFDVTGAMAVVQEAVRRRQSGGDIYLCRLKNEPKAFLKKGGFLDVIGKENVFAFEATAISKIFRLLDINRCRVCKARIFTECSEIPVSEKTDDKIEL